jgi:protein arginine N-methyltransferase 1
VAQALVTANGYASRVDFIDALSTNTTLPERADVIVMDVRGVLPDEQIAVAIDARERLLAPGGVMIPAVDALWAAPVDAPEAHDRHAAIVGDDEGLDLGAALAWAFRQSSRCRVQSSQLVGEPRLCATITYLTVRRAEVHASLEWIARRAAVAHGVVVWFESVLCEGVTLSNRPGDPEALYAQRFFPSARPIAIAAGERLQADLVSETRGDEFDWRYILHA